MATKLEKIREDIRDWYQYFGENIARFREMKSFNAGGQWESQITQEYINQQKEPLVLNLSERFIKQVVGEMLTNQPEIKITAKSENQPAKMVEMRNDLVRAICARENFDQAKQAAFFDALSGGWGVLYVYTEYAEGLTFHQDIKIETVNDSTLAFFDPSAKKPTKADGRYAGLVNYVPEKEFKRRWPGAEVCTKSFVPDEEQSYLYQDSGQKMVQVADYYEKHYKKVKVVLVSPTLTGKETDTIKKSDFDLYVKKFSQQEKERQMMAQLTGQFYEPREKPQIYQERTATIVTIKCTRATYDEELEEYDWQSEFLPVVFVAGSHTYLEGIQRTTSYTESVVDVQRFINYLWSEMVIYIRRARKEGFIGTPEMAEGREEIWRNPERVQGLLLANFDARVPGGLPIPLTNIPTIPPILIEVYESAVQTMMQIIGRTEASLGLQGNERSGKAIEMRKMQESYNTAPNYQYLCYATEQCGLIINDLMGKLFDSERPMVLKKSDGSTYPAVLNKYNEETDDTENNIADVDVMVSIDVGSNYEQQRQEEFDKMATICQLSASPAFPVMADLMGKTTRMEITNELVERLEFLQPPALQAKLAGQPPPPTPPNPAMQVEQGKLQVQQQANQLKAQQIQTEQQNNQLKYLNNVMDFRASQDRNDAEVQKALLETHQSLQDSHVQKFKHASDILKGFTNLVSAAQPQNSEGGQSNAQSQQ